MSPLPAASIFTVVDVVGGITIWTWRPALRKYPRALPTVSGTASKSIPGQSKTTRRVVKARARACLVRLGAAVAAETSAAVSAAAAAIASATRAGPRREANRTIVELLSVWRCPGLILGRPAGATAGRGGRSNGCARGAATAPAATFGRT